MNKTQLDNFIGFCFTIHTEMGNSLLDNDCEYIIEKWNKFIGVRPVDKDVYNNQIINKWIEKWKVKQYQWDELKEVVDFLSILQSRPLYTEVQTWRNVNFNMWNLEELIDLFNNKTGLNINDIHNSKYYHIHDNIKEIINEWLERPVNIRTYKLLQLGV
jgi:hypothetical protein